MSKAERIRSLQKLREDKRQADAERKEAQEAQEALDARLRSHVPDAPARIIVYGPAGAQREAHARRVAADYGLVYVSARESVQWRMLLAPSRLRSGDERQQALVAVRERLLAPECRRGWVLDNFPLSREDAQDLTAAGVAPSDIVVLEGVAEEYELVAAARAYQRSIQGVLGFFNAAHESVAAAEAPHELDGSVLVAECLHAALAAVDEEFGHAERFTRSKRYRKAASPAQQAMLAALSRQAREGRCDASRPWFWEGDQDVRTHDLWAALGDMPEGEAKLTFLSKLRMYMPEWDQRPF